MRMARCRDLYCLNHQSLVPACNIQIDQPGSAGQAGLAGLDPTQWRTKVGLLMILVTLPHNFRNIFYTTNIFSDLIQTFLNWPLITNNYSAGRDRRDPRNGHGHSKKIFRKIWSQWTPGNMQFVKICFHHFYEMLPMCRGLLFMYKTTYSMGGYSSKNSLFLLIFVVKRCLKILYVSSFFPTVFVENCSCAHFKISLLFLNITKNSLFFSFLPPFEEKKVYLTSDHVYKTQNCTELNTLFERLV